MISFWSCPQCSAKGFIEKEMSPQNVVVLARINHVKQSYPLCKSVRLNISIVPNEGEAPWKK